MPEMGLADEPIKPTMRELTVTKRNPKTTTRSEAARLATPRTSRRAAGRGSTMPTRMAPIAPPTMKRAFMMSLAEMTRPRWSTGLRCCMSAYSGTE